MHQATTRVTSVNHAWIAAMALQVCAVAHAGDPAALRTATLAASCAACHGTSGHAGPGATVPGLAGTSSDDLRDAMKAFRGDRRTGTVMPQLAKGYSDDQIDRLAAFFATRQEAR